MKARTILGLAASLILLPSVAFAEEVIIRERAPDVMVDPPGGAIERHGPPPAAIEERETTGAAPRDEDNCRRTTVHRHDADGRSTTIHKTECE
jgi:hypothetical protein